MTEDERDPQGSIYAVAFALAVWRRHLRANRAGRGNHRLRHAARLRAGPSGQCDDRARRLALGRPARRCTVGETAPDPLPHGCLPGPFARGYCEASRRCRAEARQARPIQKEGYLNQSKLV